MKIIRSPEEVKAVADAGADILMFFYGTDENLIRECTKAAKEAGIKLMADIYASPYPDQDAKNSKTWT